MFLKPFDPSHSPLIHPYVIMYWFLFFFNSPQLDSGLFPKRLCFLYKCWLSLSNLMQHSMMYFGYFAWRKNIETLASSLGVLLAVLTQYFTAVPFHSAFAETKKKGGGRHLHHLATPPHQIMKWGVHWEMCGDDGGISMERESRHRTTTWRKNCLFNPDYQSQIVPNNEHLIQCWTLPSRFQRSEALSKIFKAIARAAFPLRALVHWNDEIWRI